MDAARALFPSAAPERRILTDARITTLSLSPISDKGGGFPSTPVFGRNAQIAAIRRRLGEPKRAFRSGVGRKTSYQSCLTVSRTVCEYGSLAGLATTRS
jgi:hypothetical protein